MIAYSDFALEDAALVSHPPVQPLAGPHGEGHSILGPNAQGAFLKSLQLFGNVRLACRAAGVSAQTAYRVRRRSALFAQLWDAALVAARAHAEATLADRAINGVEEPVFYHGEEIARRRRYSDRLLLAHLARLDRMEAREDVSALLPLLDDAIAALDEGADLSEVLERAAPAAGVGQGSEAAVQGPENKPQDSVPSVPSCRKPPSSSEAVGQTETPKPCEECGGQCADPDAQLTEADCQWLGNRLDRMDAARPEDAPTPYDLAREGEGADSGAIEAAQLAAFEAGVAEWWLVIGFDELVESLCETGFNDSAEVDMLPVPQGERDHELEDGYWETDERLWPRARRRRGARHGGGSGAGR